MKSTKGTKSTKSMSSKKPSIKKYKAGAIVTDDNDKGKRKSTSKAVEYYDRFDRGMNDLGNKIKSYIPSGIKDTYKTAEKGGRDLLKKLENTDIYKKLEKRVVPDYKKGGTVGKSRKK
jgi:hypothetical protein